MKTEKLFWIIATFVALFFFLLGVEAPLIFTFFWSVAISYLISGLLIIDSSRPEISTRFMQRSVLLGISLLFIAVMIALVGTYFSLSYEIILLGKWILITGSSFTVLSISGLLLQALDKQSQEL